MRFNKAKCHLGHNNPMWAGEEWLESCSAQRDLGLLRDRQLDVSPGGQEGQSNLGLSQEQCGQQDWEVTVPLYSVPGGHTLNATFSFGSLFQKGTLRCWSKGRERKP